jgi:hypothetical protein
MQTRDFTLGPRTIAVQVHLRTTDGKSLKESLYEKAGELRGPGLWQKIREIEVYASTRPLPPEIPEGTSRGDASDAGRYQSDWGASYGTLEITKPFPVHVGIHTDGRIFGPRVIDTPVEEIELSCSLDVLFDFLAGSEKMVRFRAVDSETGALLRPDAAMIVSRNSFATNVQEAPEFEADGTVRLAWSGELGSAKLHVRLEGYAPFDREIDIPEDPVIDLGDVPLEPVTMIRGVVLDEERRPVPCSIRVKKLESDEVFREVPWGTYLQVEDDGTFEFAAGRSVYEITVLGSLWTPTRVTVDTTSGKVDDLEIILDRGVEVVLDPGKEKPRGMKVRILDASGENLLGEPASFYSGAVRVHLAPGSYVAEITAKDAPTRTIPFVVGSEPMKVELGP